ncbi:hypothetical protein EYF80_001944 [Liparis tanakae]|uniref:Uncharacterized protein n=1 Tax=Liparis tanakae TaxID=230148 RepID=A0A4Z2JCU6_9TELE|nr:hypothetical protein EYF80_001944 [Liparis tanakae]
MYGRPDYVSKARRESDLTPGSAFRVGTAARCQRHFTPRRNLRAQVCVTARFTSRFLEITIVCHLVTHRSGECVPEHIPQCVRRQTYALRPRLKQYNVPRLP